MTKIITALLATAAVVGAIAGPAAADTCGVVATSEITTDSISYDKRTQNARMRVLSAGGVESWHHDQACTAYYAFQSCTAEYKDRVWRGQKVTVQCNGVHSSGSGRDSNLCSI